MPFQGWSQRQTLEQESLLVLFFFFFNEITRVLGALSVPGTEGRNQLSHTDIYNNMDEFQRQYMIKRS